MTEVTPKSAASDTLGSAPTARLLTRSLNSSVVEWSANIYREEASGAEADRRELLRMLKDLAPGEVVTVTRIERFARSTFDLQVTCGAVGRHPTGRLMIAVLGGLAGRNTHVTPFLPKTSPNASAGIGRPPRRRRVAVPGRTALSRIAIDCPLESNLTALSGE